MAQLGTRAVGATVTKMSPLSSEANLLNLAMASDGTKLGVGQLHGNASAIVLRYSIYDPATQAEGVKESPLSASAGSSVAIVHGPSDYQLLYNDNGSLADWPWGSGPVVVHATPNGTLPEGLQIAPTATGFLLAYIDNTGALYGLFVP